MGSKTVTMSPKPEGSEPARASKQLGIQSDVAFSEAAKRLCGRDLCSISDLTVEEMAAVMELAHAVKSNPDDFRHALDGRQMVLFFEKASLRTRLTFEAAINTLGGNAIFVDQTQSPLGERESLADMAHNIERWMSVIVLRTYSHDTITEMAACSKVPVVNALSDLEHPCQAIADFFTLEERFGSAEGLRLHLCGRREQCVPLVDAHRGATWRALHGCDPEELRRNSTSFTRRDRGAGRRQHHVVDA